MLLLITCVIGWLLSMVILYQTMGGVDRPGTLGRDIFQRFGLVITGLWLLVYFAVGYFLK